MVHSLSCHVQEARMSQEQLADQVARASEERQTLEKRLQQAEKVTKHIHVYTMLMRANHLKPADLDYIQCIYKVSVYKPNSSG